ncbi:glutathione S-transferase family protein [Verminephrobacter aporrectodeae subsp. tuberculatae]|uniref:glutathione S-transferase family protein n=1 Tax=Verminephrobacter aporrectodeae TaxID=1110389 RepID=UPI002237A8FE|nr:glutathione S-transferase family protein [Verminephrobacter aporrectodeae]MCW5223157.1 glutathione S-transferase family protein [Verminephrobacter aporrectodeae subsp. tuberculatae]MCW5288621.1 glutathione S-transferase family protein [Verminephrobacter aporrectodeae subsp. tuberculatae]
MIKLYGNPYSRANRVRWALEAAGAKYEEETLSLGPEGTGSQRFRAINPNGLVPAINDEGLILFESVPICLYIAKKYAPTSLYVESIRDEGLLLQWSVWAMTELEKHNETASLHVTWFSAPKRDANIAAREQAEVSRCLSMIEEAIQESGFLVAKRFTIADLIVSEVLTALVHAKIELNDFPRVKCYLKMNLLQPSAQKAFASDVIQPYLT